jgi:hypothetical protein
MNVEKVKKRMLKAERVKTCSQRASVWTSATRSTELGEYCMYDECVCQVVWEREN